MPPGLAPLGVNLEDAEPLGFLIHLRHYAIDNFDPELLQDRRDIWEEEPLD